MRFIKKVGLTLLMLIFAYNGVSAFFTDDMTILRTNALVGSFFGIAGFVAFRVADRLYTEIAHIGHEADVTFENTKKMIEDVIKKCSGEVNNNE